MLYQNVFWDWNGTLLDDFHACFHSVNVSLSQRNLPNVSAEVHAERFRFPVSDYYIDLGFDFKKDSYETLADEYTEIYSAQKCGLRKGAKKILEKLFLNSVNQYILSACENKILMQGVKEQGIECYFKEIIGQSDYIAHGKVEAGRMHIEKNNITGNSIMVGDTVHDAEVAKALKMDCVLIFSGQNSVERLKSTGNRVIQDLSELSEIVLGKSDRHIADYMTPEKAERRSFDLSEVNRKFKDGYRSYYNDVKNTTVTEDW